MYEFVYENLDRLKGVFLAKIYEKLLRQGIITRPIGGIYEMPEYLRVSIGLASENDAFIKALHARI